MSAIFTVNATKISVPTPGRCRKTPSDYGIVVRSNKHDITADANTAELGCHLFTHTNCTFSQSLTNCQLQTEYGNTFSFQQDKVRDQKCNCKQLQTWILQYLFNSSLHTIKMTICQLFCSKVFDSVRNVRWRCWSSSDHSIVVIIVDIFKSQCIEI